MFAKIKRVNKKIPTHPLYLDSSVNIFIICFSLSLCMYMHICMHVSMDIRIHRQVPTWEQVIYILWQFTLNT